MSSGKWRPFCLSLKVLSNNLSPDPMLMQIYDAICHQLPSSFNPLCANFFQREQKHVFTFYVITPHWYDTGTYYPSSSKTSTYIFNTVNIIAADGLAT